MEIVSRAKLMEMNEAALAETRNALARMALELMEEKGLRPDQVEIIQEVTPRGIKFFVQQKEEGETRVNRSERRNDDRGPGGSASGGTDPTDPG